MKSILLVTCISLLLASSPYGKCTKGNCKNGWGTYVWKDGSIYEGQWRNSKSNGLGMFKSFYGIEYQGQWKDSAIHGRGTMVYQNGDKYVGYFKMGKRHGEGTLYDNMGRILKTGTWENDEFVSK